MTANLMRASVVSPGTLPFSQASVRLALYNTTGDPLNVPKLGAAQADNGTFTSTVAAGAAPTKAEFDALRADALTLQTTVNALLAKLRAAGIIAT